MSEIKKRTLAQHANALSKHQKKYTPILQRLQEGSQNYNILKHLLTRGSITNAEAAEMYNCYRLAARISELRRRGVNIETVMIPTNSGLSKSAYARYKIAANE